MVQSTGTPKRLKKAWHQTNYKMQQVPVSRQELVRIESTPCPVLNCLPHNRIILPPWFKWELGYCNTLAVKPGLMCDQAIKWPTNQVWVNAPAKYSYTFMFVIVYNVTSTSHRVFVTQQICMHICMLCTGPIEPTTVCNYCICIVFEWYFVILSLYFVRVFVFIVCINL